MSNFSSPSLARRVLFAAWGMATLTLLFCVILLAYALARRGEESHPASAPLTVAAPAVTPESTGKTANKDINLYFADAENDGLAAEPASIEFTEYTTENCRHALELLIKGPRTKLAPIMPNSTKIRGIYLMEDGELIIDFSLDLERDLKNLKSAGLEALLVYGITNTLAQPELKGAKEPQVATLRVLIEGSAPRESFPAHLDVSKPVTPDPQWIAGKKE